METQTSTTLQPMNGVRLMTSQETANWFHISEATLNRWCNRKRDPLPFTKPGGKDRLFREDQVLWWLEKFAN